MRVIIFSEQKILKINKNSNRYSDGLDFLPQETRIFEFMVDDVIGGGFLSEVDASKISSYDCYSKFKNYKVGE